MSSIRGDRGVAHVFIVALIGLAVAASASENAPVSREITAIVTARAVAPEAVHGRWIERIYGSANGEPVWFSAEGTRPAVATALRELREAGRRGLVPTDYDVDRLELDIEAASSLDRSPDIVARADVAMTSVVVHFLSDLHFGRVRPA